MRRVKNLHSSRPVILRHLAWTVLVSFWIDDVAACSCVLTVPRLTPIRYATLGSRGSIEKLVDNSGQYNLRQMLYVHRYRVDSELALLIFRTGSTFRISRFTPSNISIVLSRSGIMLLSRLSWKWRMTFFR